MIRRRSTLPNRGKLIAQGSLDQHTTLADFSKEKRGRLVDFFGQAGSESIALARGRKRLLWTDDFTLGAIASNDYGVSRVWTQVVSDWLGHRGCIGGDKVDEVTLNLLVAGYFFTSLRPSAILRAAEKAGWDHNVEPLRSVKDHLSLPMIEGRKIWWLAGQSMALLWRKAPIDAAAGAATHGLLQAIVGRADGKRIIDSLRSSLDAFFGLDVVSARKARMVVDDWRADRPDGLIVIP